ncbi:hypothetical protein BCV70DRAFT_101476 [Testicularia cyperi]|uniref:WSC domain-containing protein n=1 Tax=Testicularia cyperi TaxID=1882483 RepID=A0A317XR75_9BASI|nr:hypothetical protein BCV70DRAFT_101476 [Testicularia cyperi]
MKLASALGALLGAAVALAGVNAAPVQDTDVGERGLVDSILDPILFVAPYLSGYRTPYSWGNGNCAINAPGDMYIRDFFVANSYDFSLCAKQCDATTYDDAVSSTWPGFSDLFDSCNYFTAYHLYRNGKFQGTQCGLYKKNFRSREPSLPQNCGNGRVTLDNVYSYTLNGYTVTTDNTYSTDTFRSDVSPKAAKAVRQRLGISKK